MRPIDNREELPFDVVTEICFDDEEDMARGFTYLNAPEAAALIAADEERLFDRPHLRFVVVEDRETDLSASDGGLAA